MRTSLKTLTRLLAAGLLCRAATAQEDAFESGLPEGRERKQPSVLHRPAMKTPAEQLRYAHSLADENRSRAAAKQYRALVHTWHEAPEAATAQWRYAMLLEEVGKYVKAFDEYQYLLDNFTQNFDYEQVLQRQFGIANGLRSALTGGFLWFKASESPGRALPLFETLVANAPNWKRAPEAQYYIGLIHEAAKDFELAVTAFETVQLRYPDSAFASAAAFRRACCLEDIANRHVRDEHSCRRAVTALSSFLVDFPNDPNRDAAAASLEALRERLAGMYIERAVFYDKIARKPRSAVIAYTDFIRKFPSSDRRSEAEARLKALQKEVHNEEQ